ncbi:hypothetical protein AALO_G00109940 [Alosa alosa]|uniref:Uncharacterized protein n=1 Tax=Alosa alosa TaxID=278164 RepID=A0AAV6GT56_9TELE|nr:hypothetical protein AALO_G00109940 [Alosa alosa]
MTEEKNEQDTETLLKYFGAHLYLYLTLPHQVSASMADDTEGLSTAELQMPESQERSRNMYLFFGTFYF